MGTEIYTGVWINWSKGPISGATLTLTARSGGLLTAFLALFVTIVSSQVWRLLCFIIHQLRSNDNPQNKDFHQRQVILRNVASPATGAWAFLTHGVQGLKYNRKSLLRSLPWTLMSLLFVAVFGVAAVFSSSISKFSGDERLVKSVICGAWMAGIGLDEILPKLNNATYAAASYARACYGGPTNELQCSQMPVREITYTKSYNASCPFESGICMYGNTAAFEMTTKLIDSHFDLGINTPPQNRVHYQLKKTCAPINSTNHQIRYHNTPEDSYGTTGDKMIEYQFGPAAGGVGRYPNATTYIVSSHSVFGNGGYILNSYMSSSGLEDQQQWTPSRELFRADADVSIFFLEANAMVFLHPNNDPIFSAHEEIRSSNGQITFASDYWTSIFACAEQARFCNPRNNLCTPYLGDMQNLQLTTADFLGIGLNDDQILTFIRLSPATLHLGLQKQVGFRMASALRIVETALGILQPSVPDTQWMIELSSWFDTSLARLQLGVLEWATGPSNPAYVAYYEGPSNPSEARLCENQIVHGASGTISFSVLGLVIIFTVGGLAISLNQLTEVAVGFLQKRIGLGEGKRQCWIADDMMSLYLVALRSGNSLDDIDHYVYACGKAKHLELGRLNRSGRFSPSQDQLADETLEMMRPRVGSKDISRVEVESRLT